ncbi:MAG: HEAT repeat domain-containing protein [Phycisphaerales bacterium]
MRKPAEPCFLLFAFVTILCSSIAQPQDSRPGPSIEELIETLHTGNAYQRAQAISPLSRIDDPRTAPELAGLLKDSDVTVRLSTAKTLAQMADKRTADAMAEALNDQVGEVRQYAGEGLAKVGEAKHVPALVASVLSHLPDPTNVVGERSWYSAPALEAIAKLSSKAPPEFLKLMRDIPAAKNVTNGDWWETRENVARCLGQIGDKAAVEPLQEVRRSLETSYQDYRTWHAIRKALATLDPQTMPFDKPAAEILRQIQWGKGGFNGVESLVELGDPAMGDMAWILRFESPQDRERVADTLRALGRIGGEKAASVLRDYIARLAGSEPRNSRSSPSRPSGLDAQIMQRQESLCRALAALLVAMPNEATAHEVLLTAHRLSDSTQGSLVQTISGTSGGPAYRDAAAVFYEQTLLGSADAGPLSQEAAKHAAGCVGQVGGQRAGEVLSKVLLESTQVDVAASACRALWAVKDYDATPCLIEASRLENTPKDAIAYGMGCLRDERTIPALLDMRNRTDLSRKDRLWTAAALARMGTDYENSARLIREALPDSLDQATWLRDKETLAAIAKLIHPDDSQAGDRRGVTPREQRTSIGLSYPFLRNRAISVLTTIGTNDALDALGATVDLETIEDAQHLRQVSDAAAHLARKLGHPSLEHWTRVSAVTHAVTGLFGIVLSQASLPPPGWARGNVPEAITLDPALARRVWVAEFNRLAGPVTDQPDPDRWSDFSVAILYGAERIFGPELIPPLERLIKESEAVRPFRGKEAVIKHYYIRSLAAKILTEKTGRAYTFVDADGRTHPGGWDPSLEGAQ